MSPAVHYAPMRWWHIPAAVAIDRDLFGAEAWSAAQFWNELAAGPRGFYRVALDGRELIGFAGLMVTGSEASVHTIDVRADYQRQGIGGRLLAMLLAEADRRGCAHVLLEVAVDNAPALRLYERNGFTRLRIRRNYYQATGTDAVEMRRG